MAQQRISKSVEMPHLAFAPSRPVTLLINGRSRRGRAMFPTAVKACRDAGIALAQSVMVSSPEETARLLQREIEAEAALVIVGGGDGTLSFCAGQLAGTAVAMGVLPLGTGNTFARTLRGFKQSQASLLSMSCVMARRIHASLLLVFCS